MADNAPAAWLTPKRVGVVLLAYAAVWFVYGFAVRQMFDSTEAGQVGDAFGGFNAFVSGLAMLGVVGAIFLQYAQLGMQAEELRLQREELKQTRIELRGQKEALVKQNELMTLATVHQVLVPILLEYRSDDMHRAIVTLWRFYDEHPTDIAAAYQELKYNRPELAEHRRLVSQFYGLLAGLLTLGVVPREVLYSYWSERELSIIPRILLPIEAAIEKEPRPRQETAALPKFKSSFRWANMMMELYKGAARGGDDEA